MMPTTETWRPVPGFEDFYRVSDHGRVCGVDRIHTLPNGAARLVRGRVLKTDSARADGRRQVTLCREGRRTKALVAPLVLAAFVGPRPKGQMACHGNGDNTDDRLENLRWDTQSSNQLDTNAHGTNPKRKRTRCPLKHPLREPNLRADQARLGRRACLACSRAGRAVRYARSKGLDLDLQQLADEHYARIVGDDLDA